MPSPYEGDALPGELHRRGVVCVPAAGVEPAGLPLLRRPLCPLSYTGQPPHDRTGRAAVRAFFREPAAGVEPAAFRLQVGCSAV